MIRNFTEKRYKQNKCNTSLKKKKQSLGTRRTNEPTKRHPLLTFPLEEGRGKEGHTAILTSLKPLIKSPIPNDLLFKTTTSGHS